MKKFTYLVFLIYSVTLQSTITVVAQEKKLLERGQPSRYFLGQDEQMLLPVNIFGLVQKPGQYMVPFRTDLISLIAYAGGFREDAKINEVKIVRSLTTTDGEKKGSAKVFIVNVKRYFEKGDQSQIPQLMPDDTIIVSGTAAKTVNKVFDFISKLSIIAQLAFYIVVVVNR